MPANVRFVSPLLAFLCFGRRRGAEWPTISGELAKKDSELAMNDSELAIMLLHDNNNGNANDNRPTGRSTAFMLMIASSL